jgi:hypothetical protein
MDVTEAISYNKEFTDTVTKAKTDNFNPIQEIIGNKYKAIEFTNKIFERYPELMDGKGSTLYYILNAGQTKKVAVMYTIFETFVKNSQPAVFASILRDIEPVNKDVDPIFSWARYLKKTKKCYIYEPVLSFNNKVLQEFLDNKTFKLKDRATTLNDIRPLCYTNTGENIADLLPYIAYLYNFFINCNNYTFGEILAGSTHNSFFESIEANFTKYYQKLIASTDGMNMTKLFAKPHELVKHFGNDILKSMYSEMLNPENIIQIRNDIIINDATKQLQKAISQQTSVTKNVVQAGFHKVLCDLVEIVIQQNPITKVFRKLPLFCAKTINEYELGQWTAYAMSGGAEPFMINRDLTYMGIGDIKNHNAVDFLPPQRLVTEIRQLPLSSKKPFINSSIGLQLASAYAKSKFTEYQNDILNDFPISIDESFIATEKHGVDTMENIITGLFVNGIYSKDLDTLNEIFAILKGNPRFMKAIEDIMKLPNLLNSFFTNTYGAKIMSAYILSFIPEWLLKFIVTNGSALSITLPATKAVNLNMFCPMAMFCQAHEIDNLRIEKLLALETSLMYLHNKSYTNFINNCIDEFVTILNDNAFIQQPYVKGTSDNVGVYAIGGRDLVAKAALSNPLSRSYWFVSLTQGTCAAMETFYGWIKYLDNQNAYDIIAQAILENNTDTIKTVLVTRYNEMISSNNIPLMLSNYTFNPDGTWVAKVTPYYTDLTLPDGTSVIQFLIGYTFNETHAKNIADNELIMKPIAFTNNQFIAKPTMFNKALFGSMQVGAILSEFGTNFKLPYYDFNAVLDDFSVEISAPPGYKNIYLQTDSGRQTGNDVYFLYTRLNTTKFGNKRFANNFDDIVEPTDNVTVRTDMGNRPDNKRTFTTDAYNPYANSKKKQFPNTTRMKLVGADRK